jgi:lysyl endopeptidase
MSFSIVLALWLLAGPLTAAAQTPTEQFSSLRSLSDVDRRSLPANEIPDDPASAATGETEITPYAYGVVVDADLTPATAGTWERTDEHWVWRLRLRSPDARSVSVAFDRFRLPPDARLYVRDPDGTQIHGPYRAADATNGAHRTPLLRSEDVVVELQVPRGEREDVDLRIGHIIHGYRSILPSGRDGAPAKDGACNVDVTCRQALNWFPVYRSVGLYTFEIGGTASVCTGSLVNNTAEDRRPLFLTAEHCISSPEEAETMVFYWNYQNPTCRSRGTPANAEAPDDSLQAQTSSGAVLRARFGNVHRTGGIARRSDLALVEIDDVLPDAYNLYFAGWDRSGTAPDEAVSVHHPSGDAKRISFDRDPVVRTPYLQPESEPGGTHWLVDAWEVGTTEPGSSGAPLYNENQRIIGVLSGGFAACTSPLSDEDNDEPDWYGSLAHGFNRGDYETRTVADVLDPAGQRPQSLGGLPFTPDPQAPAPIDDFGVDRTSASSVDLSWTAPGDDGSEGSAFRYDLAVSTDGPIRTAADFDRARLIQDVPAPETAGTPQSATVSVSQDSTYYFAIRAIDDAGKSSGIQPLRSDTGTLYGISPTDRLQLRGPAPNPASQRTRIEIGSPVTREAQIEIYDTLGRRVVETNNQTVQAGRTVVVPLDVSRLAAGVHFIRVRIGNEQEVRPLSVVR